MIRLILTILLMMMAHGGGAWGFATDTGVHAEPTVPTLPAAGSSFVDTTYGTQVIRLTDSNDSATECFVNYSNMPVFNATDTKVSALCQVSPIRWKIWDWNSKTNTRSNPRIQSNPPAGLQEYFAIWSHTAYNKFVACAGRALYEVTVPDGASTTFTNTVIRDFAAEIGGTTSDYCTQVSVSNDDDVFAMHYVVSGTATGYLVYRRSTNTVLLQVGNEGTINEVEIDKSGRYLVALKSGGVLDVWDLQAGGGPAETRVTTDSFNHRAMGNGRVVSGCLTRRLCIRNLATPNTVTGILPDEAWSYASQQDHFSMIGHSDSWLLSCRYHDNGGAVTNAYDNECLQIRTDGPGNVRRFAHHFTRAYSDDYDAQPKGVLSYSGRYFAFVSNWNGADNSARNDVFIVDMYPAKVSGDVGF